MTFKKYYDLSRKIGKDWNRQKNPPKFYTKGGTRIHHYHVGLGGLVLSEIIRYYGDNQEQKIADDIAGFSTGLVVDDMKDLVDAAIRFVKKLTSSNPYYL